MSSTCPFFGKCGGCRFDVMADDYRKQKLATLPKFLDSCNPIWIAWGQRRRADAAFAGGEFGFFQNGTKNIVPVRFCPNLSQKINTILPMLADLPWGGTGACLITECENGIDVAITSGVPYFTQEFKNAANNIPAIRITWNNKVVTQSQQPIVKFGDHAVQYPSNAFLQPTIVGADELRQLVVSRAVGAKRVADLFCGLGNFTFALNADGFDIVGTGVKRDLFKKPLTVGMLNNYDCVVMDPPRAGADAQCKEIINSNVKRIIYVSCNPNTFVRDKSTLEHGGYKMVEIIPVDHFVGSNHWELFSVFEKQ